MFLPLKSMEAVDPLSDQVRQQHPCLPSPDRPNRNSARQKATLRKHAHYCMRLSFHDEAKPNTKSTRQYHLSFHTLRLQWRKQNPNMDVVKYFVDHYSLALFQKHHPWLRLCVHALPGTEALIHLQNLEFYSLQSHHVIQIQQQAIQTKFQRTQALLNTWLVRVR